MYNNSDLQKLPHFQRRAQLKFSFSDRLRGHREFPNRWCWTCNLRLSVIKNEHLWHFCANLHCNLWLNSWFWESDSFRR